MTAFRPNNDHARVRYVRLRRYSPRVGEKLRKSGPQKMGYLLVLLVRDGETTKKKGGGREKKDEPGKEVVNEQAENEGEGTTGNIRKRKKKEKEARERNVSRLSTYVNIPVTRARPSSLGLPADEKFLTKKGGLYTVVDFVEEKRKTILPKPRSPFFLFSYFFVESGRKMRSYTRERNTDADRSAPLA